MISNSRPAGTHTGMPQGDMAREAVDSLRGYAYQVTATALAWLDLDDRGRLYLEVAEDYATVAGDALAAVQVKDTAASGTITLRTASVRDAVASYVAMVERNPDLRVRMRYFTTSEIGQERAQVDRPDGEAGSAYWRRAAAGGDVAPLRAILEGDGFTPAVQAFVSGRDDEAVRDDLLRRVHWDCGQPDLANLRLEFEERLTVVGRDTFNLPARDARAFADALVHRVLLKATAEDGRSRFLTRAELYNAIETVATISMPRGVVAELLAKVASGLPGSPGSADLVPEDVLVQGASFPAPTGMIGRAEVERRLGEALRDGGLAILTGASGLGKSSTARATLRRRASAVVELRGEDAPATRRRVDAVIARLGGASADALILEDLDHFEEPSMTSVLGRLMEGCRRRDIVVVATCYRPPSTRVLTEIGASPSCLVECAYFCVEEACALVTLHGGGAEPWGRLAWASGGLGHPQLTHAFVVGMAARGWPASEAREVVLRGMGSDDTDSARDAARRGLAAALPDGTRATLYRLSLTRIRFDRQLALTVARAAPAIDQPGPGFDQLVGPWIEDVGRGRFRVSPLASDFGRDEMAEEERAVVHRTIAEALLRRRTVDAGDANAILMHALVGRSEVALTALAHSVMSAQAETFELVAEHMDILSLLGTDRPIFTGNAVISAMLRLAQFRIAAARKERENAAPIARALLAEARALPPSLRNGFEAMALVTVLMTPDVADYLDEWVGLIVRFRELMRSEAILRVVERDAERDGFDLPATFFAIGSSWSAHRRLSCCRGGL